MCNHKGPYGKEQKGHCQGQAGDDGVRVFISDSGRDLKEGLCALWELIKAKK